MTKHIAHAEVISPDAGLIDGASLDVIGPADLESGMELLLRFTAGQSIRGRVLRIEDAGARAVVEAGGKRWWLRRRDVVRVGGIAPYGWAVGGEELP